MEDKVEHPGGRVTRQGVIDDILREMNRLGISQRALSLKMGLSEPRITQALGAASNPTLKTVERIWNALLLIDAGQIEARKHAEFEEAGRRIYGLGYNAKHPRVTA